MGHTDRLVSYGGDAVSDGCGEPQVILVPAKHILESPEERAKFLVLSWGKVDVTNIDIAGEVVILAPFAGMDCIGTYSHMWLKPTKMPSRRT